MKPGKYKINKTKLREYCDKYSWIYHDIEIIEIYGDYFSGIELNGKYHKTYQTRAHYNYLPEDCLMPLRSVKLKRLLSIE